MPNYLVAEIAATANIEVRTGTRVVDGARTHRLERVTIESAAGREEMEVAGLFVLIGAEPRTGWLASALARGESGAILAGRDLPVEAWPLDRAPLPLETSLPGVFVAGDVRSGSVKRVVSAVGDGGEAIGQVHQYLADPFFASV